MLQASDTIIAARGKLIEHPDAMPVFYNRECCYYMINRKESDCMQAEDRRNFKPGGFKLFKEVHVQNILINRKETKFDVECRCLPEMKKDRTYNIRVKMRYPALQSCKNGTNLEKTPGFTTF